MNTAVHPKIDLTLCESSQIYAHGHCPETNRLHLQFKSKGGAGAVYEYQNFTSTDYAAFLAAESKGSHFGKFIKKETEKHPFTRVVEPPKPDDEAA